MKFEPVYLYTTYLLVFKNNWNYDNLILYSIYNKCIPFYFKDDECHLIELSHGDVTFRDIILETKFFFNERFETKLLYDSVYYFKVFYIYF